MCAIVCGLIQGYEQRNCARDQVNKALLSGVMASTYYSQNVILKSFASLIQNYHKCATNTFPPGFVITATYVL